MARDALYITTYACDRACDYCFNQPGAPPKRIAGLGEALRSLDVRQVYVSGGEPSLQPSLPSVITELQRSLPVILFSNGRVLQTYGAQAVASWGLKGLNISIDPHSSDDPAQSYRDQDGAFFPELLAFAQAKGTTKLTILSTFTNDTVPALTEFLALPHMRTADRVFLQPLSVAPTHPLYGKTIDALAKPERDALFDKLEKLASGEDTAHLRIMRDHYDGRDADGTASTLPACTMGVNYLVIEPNGDIAACPHNKATQTGRNIMRDSAADIDAALREAQEEIADGHCRSTQCICLYSHLVRRNPAASIPSVQSIHSIQSLQSIQQEGEP